MMVYSQSIPSPLQGTSQHVSDPHPTGHLLAREASSGGGAPCSPYRVPTSGHPLFLHPIQAKLLLGGVNDRYEQEADHVADQVVSQLYAPAARPLAPQPPAEGPVFSPLVQRQPTPSPQPSVTASAPTSASGSSEVEGAIVQASYGGHPLPPGIQRTMEDTFQTPLEGVRVHTDLVAHRLNEQLHSRAFTTGQDIFFRQGEYNPHSRSGTALLAHELTHTLQQRHSDVGSVLQAKIGFEFQAFGSAYFHPIGSGSVASPPDSPPSSFFRDIVGRGDGFSVEGDMGTYPDELELVTEPVDETASGRQRLGEILASIQTFCQKISRRKITPVRELPAYGIQLEGSGIDQQDTMELVVLNELNFHPQATTGVRLETLSHLIDLLAHSKIRGFGKGKGKGKGKGLVEEGDRQALADTVGWSQLREQQPFRETTRAAHTDVLAYFPLASPRLKGFVHLLATMVRGFGVPYLYPDPSLKYFMPLMPRTELAAVYHHLLSPEERATFQAGVERWIVQERLLKRPIPTAVDWTPAEPLSIGDWLHHLATTGEDWLKQSSSYGEIELEDEDSMKNAYWQVSRPTDIGPDERSEVSREGMILELRHLGANVTPTKIQEFALGVFDLVSSVHGEQRDAVADVEAMELSQVSVPPLLEAGRKRPPTQLDEGSVAKRLEPMDSGTPLLDHSPVQQLALELVLSGYGIKATARLLGLNVSALSAAYGAFAQGAEGAEGAEVLPTPEGLGDRLREQGVQQPRVTAFLSEPRRQRFRQYSPDFREAIVYLVKHSEYDYSHAQITKVLGIPQQTIATWCNDKRTSPS